jgi:predicted Zn finger-like uncharacterized protein
MVLRVTQCPGCESTFNTSARMLGAAAGMVRCGACLNVFEALENFTDEAANQTNQFAEDSVFVTDSEEYFNPLAFLSRSALTESLEDPLGEVETARQEIQSSLIDHQEYPLDETDPAKLEIMLAVDEPFQQSEISKQASAPTELEADYQQSAPEQPLLPVIFPTEEIAETPNQAEVAGSIYQESIESERFEPVTPDICPTIGEKEALNDETETEDSVPDEIDEPIAESTEEDFGEAEAAPFAAATPDQLVPLENIESTENQAPDVQQAQIEDQSSTDKPDLTEIIRAKALNTELKDESALEALPRKTLDAIAKVAYPLELESMPARRMRQRLLTLAFVLLLMGTLAAQVLWLQMEQLSQSAQFRPLYERACQWISCDLPVFIDNSAIRSDSLLVRSHPEISDALEVLVIFHNDAQFPQPFPLLQLGFTDLDNQVVATREFTADEYLDPALRDIQFMPVQSPIQITLEILNPGPNAINYKVSFRSYFE